ITVAVTVESQDGPVAFATTSFMPISRDDALRFEMVTLLREMAAPGDPSGSLVASTTDPLMAARGITTVNLATFEAKAARLSAAATELLNMWERDGTKPVVRDPRKAWARPDVAGGSPGR